MTKIKICGLRRSEDIDIVNRCQPDYAGFIFAPGKRRTVTAEQAKRFRENLDDHILTVGVFLNNEAELVIELAKQKIINCIQLHGDEDTEYIRLLRKHTNIPIIRAVRVRTAEDILAADKLPVDYLLFDTYDPNAYGGTGKVFDWSIIPKISKPYFLAGGINVYNIENALRYGAYCIDVSSGAETDGVKDEKKIAELIKIVRRR